MILPEQLQAEAIIAVIVQAVPAGDPLDREELALIYRRKKLFWDNGARVIPVNLPAAHPLRLRFSRLVLGVLPEEMEAYWNAQYFHGIAPPYVLASEEAVLQFVATTPGAIGYVSAALVTAQVQVVLYLSLSSEEKRP